MADNKKICEAGENPSEEPEEEPSQQESLQPEQTSQPQQTTSEQSSEGSSASTPRLDAARWIAEMSNPNFDPAQLTIEEQVAYMRHKYCSIYAIPITDLYMPRRRQPTTPEKPQPPPPLHNRVPSLGSPERRKLHFKHPYPFHASPGISRPQSSPSPPQRPLSPSFRAVQQQPLPPSWQAVQQYSSQTPPKSRSENYNQARVQGWLSTLRKHEKEQEEKDKKEQEEKAEKEQEEKTKKELEEKAKKEQEEKAKKEQEEKAEKEQEEKTQEKQEEKRN